MVERRGDARFADEPVSEGDILGEVRREDLEGDPALQLEMLGEVDDAHPAPGDDPFETMARNFDSQGEAHVHQCVVPLRRNRRCTDLDLTLSIALPTIDGTRTSGAP